MTPEYKDWIERARAVPIASVVQRVSIPGLVKSTEGYQGPCPACHDGVDRFGINLKKNLCWCRQCQNGGGSIDLVMMANGMAFHDAVEFILNEPPPNGVSKSAPVDPEVIRERNEARRAQVQDQAERDVAEAADKRRRAQEMFDKGKPFPGTLAEKYLQGRKIHLRPDQSFDLRFVPEMNYRGFSDSEAKEQTTLGSFPVMVAAIRNGADELIGVHMTYLDRKTGGKLTPPGCQKRNKSKKVWPAQVGGRIRLSPPCEVMATGEGIETTASWWALGVGPETVGMFAGVNLGNLSGPMTGAAPHPKFPDVDAKRIPNGVPDLTKPAIEYPKGTKRIILLGDGDSDYHVTRAKMLAAGRRAEAQGIASDISFAPDGKDFNNVLRDGVKAPAIVGFKAFEAEMQTQLYPVVQKPAFKSRFGMLPWEDLDHVGDEEKFIVRDLLTEGDKSIIGGPSQSGKSFLAIEFGMCIARGTPVFGKRVERGLVVYQAGEGARGVKKRLRAYRQFHKVPKEERVPFVLLQSRVDLFSAEGDTKPLIDEINQIRTMYEDPLKIIFIDTLAKAQGIADENSGKDMGLVLNNIDMIREKTGVAVCLVHHLNADGTKLRGHTSVFANIDQVLSVTADKVSKVRTVKTAKMKDGNDDLEIKFELMQVKLGEDSYGEPITSCVVLPLGEKEVQRMARDRGQFRAKDVEREFMKALFAADQEYGMERPNIPEIPEAVKRVVLYRDVQNVFASLSMRVDEDERKAKGRIRAAITRAGRPLIDAKVIGKHEHYIWWTGREVMGVPETWKKQPKDDLPPLPKADPSADEILNEIPF